MQGKSARFFFRLVIGILTLSSILAFQNCAQIKGITADGNPYEGMTAGNGVQEPSTPPTGGTNTPPNQDPIRQQTARLEPLVAKQLIQFVRFGVDAQNKEWIQLTYMVGNVTYNYWLPGTNATQASDGSWNINFNLTAGSETIESMSFLKNASGVADYARVRIINSSGALLRVEEFD